MSKRGLSVVSCSLAYSTQQATSMQQDKAAVVEQMHSDWSNCSSNQSAMKQSAVHLEERQEHLEKRMESLENVLVEMNAFLARISAEVLNLRVGSSPTKKGTHIAKDEQQDKVPSSRMHSLSEALSFCEERKKQQPYQTDLQQEESGESYSFQFSDKGALSSPSDQSSNRSYESGKDATLSQQDSSKIPLYKGERDAEIIWTWLDKVENYFKVGHATEDEKVLIATYHLKDGAYYWWKNLKARSGETITSWEELKKVFLKSFMPLNYLREAKFALMDLRQVNMSVKEYNSQFCRLVHRVLCLAEEDKVAYYVHGLKCNVRMEVDDHNPRTLADAMRLGEVSEAKKYAWKTGFLE